jgi:dTDP-4-amino-4,6-dideoxygalactose transaminase
MNDVIPFNRASFHGNELANLSQSLLDGRVSGIGPFTQRAQSMLDERHGSGRSLLTTSCTSALEIAARLIDVRPGDEVIVPAYTFVTSASAFMIHGATPVFVDVREDTLNLDPSLVEAAITPRTRAICAVNYAGVGATPDVFRDIADRHDLMLIEDNALGFGGTYDGQALGTFGQVSTLSFHETKTITCGEGGALHLNDLRLVERAEVLREKGTDRSQFMRGEVQNYTWVDVGSSWEMADLLAGVLVGQLERFDEIQAHRSRNWNRYRDGLAKWATEYGVRTPDIPDNCGHNAQTFHLRFDSVDTRCAFITHLRERDIVAVFHYQPLHLSTIGEQLGGRPGQHPVSEDAGHTLVRLPLHAELGENDLDRVVESVIEFQPGRVGT